MTQRNTKITNIFRARVNFCEAGVTLYKGLVLTTLPREERDEYQDELDGYKAQAAVLAMNDPELVEVNKSGGMEGSAARDEIRRRAAMTKHENLQETGVRSQIRRDREIKSPDLRARARFRGIEIEGWSGEPHRPSADRAASPLPQNGRCGRQ